MKRILIISVLTLVLNVSDVFAQLGHGMMRGGGKRSFASNGERIYYTGISERTGQIPFQGGPMWLRMHGGGCVNCHGVDGRGGVSVMMGTAIPSDIRYSRLIEHKHGEKQQAYTDELIRRAITNGLDPSEKMLDFTMPRWIMTKEDLDDIIEYLKTLE